MMPLPLSRIETTIILFREAGALNPHSLWVLPLVTAVFDVMRRADTEADCKHVSPQNHRVADEEIRSRYYLNLLRYLGSASRFRQSFVTIGADLAQRRSQN